jgi:O-methyltransferase domain
MSELAPEAVVWNLLRGALATRALGLVADLGVADALAVGPRGVEGLAAELGADSDTLHRLLRALASDGIFAEEERGTFRNTAASNLLRGDGWGDFAHLFGGVWHRAVGESTRPGARPPSRGSSAPRSGRGSPLIRTSALHSTERWSRVRSGGSNGSVSSTGAATRRSSTSAAGMGRCSSSSCAGSPACVGSSSISRRPPATRRASAPAARSSPATFSSASRSATILHDWDDGCAAAILRTIQAAAPADARLIVLDAVVPPGNEPHGAKWLDLLMLALFSGRERDEEQWRALLDGAGFEPVRIDDRLIEARCQAYGA